MYTETVKTQLFTLKNASTINNNNGSTEIISNDPMSNNRKRQYNSNNSENMPINNYLNSLNYKEDTYRNNKKQHLDDTAALVSNDSIDVESILPIQKSTIPIQELSVSINFVEIFVSYIW